MQARFVKRRTLAPTALGVLLGAGWSPVHADCSPLALCSCSVSASPVQFGTYNALNPTPTDGAGNIQVSCTAGPGAASLSYEIRLSTGMSGVYQPRRMAGASVAAMAYNLFTDPARTQVWGDGNGGTVTVSGGFTTLLPSDNVRNHTVFGRVPADQMLESGMYSDSILVTVSY